MFDMANLIPSKSNMLQGARAPGNRKMPSGLYSHGSDAARLLDLRFLEFDVLARDRVVLAHAHLFRLVPRVFLGDIVKTRPGCRYEFDLLGHGLRHGLSPYGSTIFSGPETTPAMPSVKSRIC